MMYFRPSPPVMDPTFLLHSIYGPLARTYIQHAVNGSTVGHLRLGQVGAIPLLWCPLEEQREIVAFISEESKPIDDTLRRIEIEISLLREYRTRLVSDVVTGKLDAREAAARLLDVAETDIPEVDDAELDSEEADEEVIT